jgi:hypothetical protein
MELGAEQSFVRQHRLIFGYQGRRDAAAEGVFDNLGILGGAEKHADGGALVGFPHIAVKGFEVELKLAEMLGLELVDLQLDGNEAHQPPVEEQEIKGKVPTTNLHRVFGANEAEISAEFGDEAAQIAQ